LNIALTNILFRNTLRTYITTLMKFSAEPATPVHAKLEYVYKNLVLNRYQNLDEFSSGLKDALNNEEIQHHALSLLCSVFDSSYNPLVEQHEDMEVDLELQVDDQSNLGEETKVDVVQTEEPVVHD
jgi:hypothetical protein